MAVLIAELYGQVFGSPGTGLVRHTIYWLYPSWNHITILGSNVVIYMVYEATTSKEVFGQTWKKPTN